MNHANDSVDPVQGELLEDAQAEPLTAADEAAREGVSVRTIYKRRAKAREAEARTARERTRLTPATLQIGTQGVVQAELVQENETLKAEVNNLKGQLKVQSDELTFYRDIVTRMLPARSTAEVAGVATVKRRGLWPWIVATSVLVLAAIGASVAVWQGWIP